MEPTFSKTTKVKKNYTLIEGSPDLQAKSEKDLSAGAGMPLFLQPFAPSPTSSLPLQTKLVVKQPGDCHEQEADRVAEQVTSGSHATIASRLSPSGSSEPVQFQPQPSTASTFASFAHLGSGQPLDPILRGKMEAQFGYDFSQVRIHTNSEASESAHLANALAYTNKHNIVFAENQYTPSTTSGLRLLAHELTHVVQQIGSQHPPDASHSLDITPATSEQVQRQAAPGSTPVIPSTGASVDKLVEGATGIPVGNYAFGVSVTIAGGQILTADDIKMIHTLVDTTVNLQVTSNALEITFTPGLVITAESGSVFLPNPDIYLSEVRLNFKTGGFSFAYSAPKYAIWGGASEKLGSGLAPLLGKLPTAMLTPGYDPFADPNIQSNLAVLAAGFTAGGGGGSLPKTTAASASGEAVLGGEVRQNIGSASLVIPASTHIAVDVNLMGGIPERLDDIRIATIFLRLSSVKGGAAVNLKALDTDLPLIHITGATFTAGGGLQFSYTLATEAIEGAFRVLIASAAIAAGKGNLIGEDALNVRQEKMHVAVDAAVHQHIDPLLRELILANRHIVPGIDLGIVFGFGGEKGDFPATVAPAGSTYG